MKHSSHADSFLTSIHAQNSRRDLISIALAMFVLFHSRTLPAQQTKASESAVKATYLYNFSRFVQWPTDAVPAKGNSFSICVLGEDPFGPVLDSIISGESISGKAVVAK